MNTHDPFTVTHPGERRERRFYGFEERPPSAASARGRGSNRHLGRYRIQECRRTDDLLPHIEAWERLAANALEPNPALEPFYHLAGLRALAARERRVVTALAWRTTPEGGGFGKPELVGVFACRINAGPARAIGGPSGCWVHENSFLGTPLLNPDHARETLAAFLDWFGREYGGSFLFRMVPPDGPFAKVLTRLLDSAGRPFACLDRFARAAMVASDDAPACLRRRVSGRKIRKLRRQRRRLGELGELEVRRYSAGDDPAFFARDFLTLEARGWKGAAGTAMACRADTRAFFCSIVEGMAEAGHLRFWSLTLDGTPIAMTLGYAGHGRAWLFKIAYDEAYSRYSPGTLNILDLMDDVARDERIALVDCCADANHPQFDYLWGERLEFHDMLVACRATNGAPAFAIAVLIEKSRRSLRKLAKRVYLAARRIQPNPPRATGGG